MEYHVKLDQHEALVREYEAYPVETGKVLLYGSSFFTRWKFERAAKQCAEATSGRLQVVNHGFGGATVEELLYYYPRLVTPYKPSAVVLRLGPNDLFHGLAPELAWFMAERLINFLQTDYPGMPIILVNHFDNKKATPERYPLYVEYNAYMKAFAEKTENVTFLDLNTFFHENPADAGSLNGLRDVFVADGLHLTDAGYEEMAAFFAPRVCNILYGE